MVLDGRGFAGLGLAGLGLATWSRAAVLALALLTAPSVARAADDKPQDKTYVMKIALATLDDVLHQYA